MDAPLDARAPNQLCANLKGSLSVHVINPRLHDNVSSVYVHNPEAHRALPAWSRVHLTYNSLSSPCLMVHGLASVDRAMRKFLQNAPLTAATKSSLKSLWADSRLNAPGVWTDIGRYALLYSLGGLYTDLNANLLPSGARAVVSRRQHSNQGPIRFQLNELIVCLPMASGERLACQQSAAVH